MELYRVNDVINQSQYFFVSDDATKAQGETLNLRNATWIVGTIDDANAKLNEFASAYLELPETKARISCAKVIGQDAQGNNSWVSCNFLTEPDNTDTIYEFFTDTNPGFTKATGTQEAQSVYKQKQQDVLAWIGLDKVTTFDALPTPPQKAV
jgi:hypothetical protein